MMCFSTLVLDRYDLQEKSKNKPVDDLEPDDFKVTFGNLIKATRIILFNEFDDSVTPSRMTRTIVFKSDCTLKGEIK